MSSSSKGAFEAEAAPHPPPSFQESMAQQPLFKSQYACLTFNMTDRIRLISFPEPEILAVREAIQECWPRGISNVRPYGRSYEIKVNGSPWNDGDDDSRRLVLGVLEKLFNMGWVLQACTNPTQSKDSLVFRKQDPAPPPCEWIVVSFDNSDTLKIVGALPSDLSALVVDTFKTQITKHEVAPERLKVKFQGTPWMPNGEETVTARLVLLALLETLERCGFTIYASVSFQDTGKRDTDVLVCQRQRDWVPGAPIWHR